MDTEKWNTAVDSESLVELEPLLIAIGSYLFNGGEVGKIDVEYLEDLSLFINAEIEKRGATIH
jgi:hypothetical protein|tara:strand:- start:939 stop:1127 length:189 start_codon:yes stop_codon:yes gene_type:complete